MLPGGHVLTAARDAQGTVWELWRAMQYSPEAQVGVGAGIPCTTLVYFPYSPRNVLPITQV